MLGVEGDMIPVIAFVVVIGVGGVAVRLFLGDVAPLLVKLNLPGRLGKKPRVRRSGFGPANRSREPVE